MDTAASTAEGARRVLVLDGGLGSTLESHYDVCVAQDCLWMTRLLLDDPDLLREVHQRFFESGAEVVTSASYQFSFEGFRKAKGLERAQSERLLPLSVQLMRDATRGKAGRLVAASLGTFGATLAAGMEYSGNYGKSENELMHFHYDRLLALVKGGVEPDFLAFETVPCVVEVSAIIAAIEKVKEETLGSPLPSTWIALACSSERTLNSGEPIGAAVQMIEGSAHVNYLGFNCLSARNLTKILERIDSVGKPLVVYPNSGELYENRKWVPGTRTTPSELEEHVTKWLKHQRVEIIGGCCRTGFEYVSHLRKLVDSVRRKE